MRWQPEFQRQEALEKFRKRVQQFVQSRRPTRVREAFLSKYYIDYHLEVVPLESQSIPQLANLVSRQRASPWGVEPGLEEKLQRLRDIRDDLRSRLGILERAGRVHLSKDENYWQALRIVSEEKQKLHELTPEKLASIIISPQGSGQGLTFELNWSGDKRKALQAESMEEAQRLLAAVETATRYQGFILEPEMASNPNSRPRARRSPTVAVELLPLKPLPASTAVQDLVAEKDMVFLKEEAPDRLLTLEAEAKRLNFLKPATHAKNPGDRARGWKFFVLPAQKVVVAVPRGVGYHEVIRAIFSRIGHHGGRRIADHLAIASPRSRSEPAINMPVLGQVTRVVQKVHNVVFINLRQPIAVDDKVSIFSRRTSELHDFGVVRIERKGSPFLAFHHRWLQVGEATPDHLLDWGLIPNRWNSRLWVASIEKESKKQT